MEGWGVQESPWFGMSFNFQNHSSGRPSRALLDEII
jgi:hypothetical protein